MDQFPELPEMEEDFPLELAKGEPFQYSLEGLPELSGLSEAQLSDTSSLFSPAEEMAGSEIPALEPGYPQEGDFPTQEIGLPQENSEEPLPSEEGFSFSDNSEQKDSQQLSDIHSELKELTRLFRENKPSSPAKSHQLIQNFSYRLPK